MLKLSRNRVFNKKMIAISLIKILKVLFDHIDMCVLDVDLAKYFPHNDKSIYTYISRFWNS